MELLPLVTLVTVCCHTCSTKSFWSWTWVIRADHTPVGRPQEEGMMSAAARFPQYETKVIEPVGLESRSRRCWGWNLARRSTRDSVSNVEPTHNTTKILCPNETVRLSISLACWKQRIRHIVWKMMVTCREMQKVMIVVDLYWDVKEWTRVHSSLVLSLHDK